MDTELELRYEELCDREEEENFTHSDLVLEVGLFYASTGLKRYDFSDVVLIEFCVD